MKNKPAIIFFLTAFFGSFLLYLSPEVSALSLEDLVGTEQSRALLGGENPVLAQFKDINPRLIPMNESLRAIIERSRRSLEPNVMVETLHIYRKPGQDAEQWSAEEEVKLFNGALSLSTLAGLQYYSATRRAMRTFYETSSVIDGPVTKKPLPDPVYSLPPVQLTIYARQKDLSFGDNIYQYDYFSSPGAMIFIQQNLTSLTYGIIPAVGKNRLNTVVAILDAEDFLLVYIGSMSKTASIPGMKERISNSFANRAEAVFHWFSDQADSVFKN